jgi:hypothetical protein
MTDPRSRILARRARFVAAALGAATLAACGSSTSEEPGPKDTGAADGSADGADTGPVPCLDMPPPDSGLDGGPGDGGPGDGGDGSTGDGSTGDAARDTAPDVAEDTGPAACLKVPFDSGTD